MKFTAVSYLVHRELAWSRRVTGVYRRDALAARNDSSVLELANIDMVLVMRYLAKLDK